MKTSSEQRPAALLPLGDGNYHYNWNITEKEAPAAGMNGENNAETRTQFEYDTAFIAGEPTVAKIVNAVVHETYSDEEISLMNAQHQAASMGLDDEPEGYGNYLAMVVSTRTAAATAIAELRLAQQTAQETAPQPIVTETSEVEEETSEAEEESSEAEEESISQEQVGSVEEVLGDLVGQQ
jgi:hypothetical protein